MNLPYRLLGILVLGGTLVAQTGVISGKVKDLSTGLPLVGAQVIVNETNRGSVSDLEGLFTITIVEGIYKLTSSMIGYAPEEVSVTVKESHSTLISFGLTPVVIESKQVITVQGERASDTMFDHFQETNSSTTENLISLVEGVNLITRGSYAQEPVIRGMSGGRMNIMINGMKSFGACTDRMDPVSSYVEADVLSSVEIGKGALSVLHGGTVGGSLNMILTRPQYAPEGNTLWRIKGKINSRTRERKVSLFGQKQFAQSSWSLSGAYRKAENYSDAMNRIIPFSGFEKLNLNLGYKKRVGERSQLLVEAVSDDAYNIGYSSLPMDVRYARLRMLGVSLHSAGMSPRLLKLDWKVYGNAIDHWMDDRNREELFMDMHMDMPGFTRTVGSYVDLFFRMNPHSLLKLRSEYYWTSAYADMVMYPENSSPMKMVTWPGVSRSNVGQFAEYQLSMGKQIALNASIRYDYFFTAANDEMGKNELQIYYPENDLIRQDHFISANTFLTYTVTSNWQTVLAAARGSRVPTVSEAYGYYLYNPVDGYLYLGDPDIPVETSLQIEWQNKIRTDNTIFNLTIYRYRFMNYIFGQIMNGTSLGYAYGWKKYVDAGEARLSGVELSLLHQGSPHWVFQLGLSYEQGNLIDFNDYLPLIPPLEGHASLKYHIESFWLQLDTKASRSQRQISVLSGENETPEFLIFNLKGEYVLSRGLVMSVGINNLTNQLYYEHLDWGDIFRPGRSGQISIILDQSAFGRGKSTNPN